MKKFVREKTIFSKKLTKTTTLTLAILIATIMIFSSFVSAAGVNVSPNQTFVKKVQPTNPAQESKSPINTIAIENKGNSNPGPYDTAPMGVPILTEGFEGSWLPAGWSVIQTNPGPGSGSIPPYWDQTSYDYHSGSYAAGVWWDYNHQDEWLISPEVTLTGSTTGNYYVTFWTYGWEGSIYDDHYYVKVSTDNGTTWTALFDLSDLTGNDWNDWEYPYTVNLNAYAGQDVKLAWHAIDCNDPGNPNYPGLWYIWIIDDIEIGYYDVPDDDVGVTSIDAPVSGTATGPITPKATVENFGALDKTNVPVDMEITAYGTPSTILSDGFESYTPGAYILPAGWTIDTTNPTGTWFMYASTSTYSASTYPRVQESGSDGNAQDESLISPTIDCSGLVNVRVQFTKSFYAYSPDYASFTLYGSRDNGATWPYTIVQYTATSTSAENIDITSWAAGYSQVKFKFRFESPADTTLSSYMYFDNFWVGDNVLWGPLGDNPPIGWTISNNPTNPTTWNNNYWHRYTTLYTSYDSMYYPARVYYTSPYQDVDVSLITPTIDCSGLTTAYLYLNGYFYYYATNPGRGYIEVSTDGGTTWVDTGVITNTASQYFYEYPGYNNIDITTWAAGESNVKVRFRYEHTAAEAGRYWYLSNVRVGDGSGSYIFYDSFQGPQAYSTNFKVWSPDDWDIWSQEVVMGTDPDNAWYNLESGTSPTCTPHGGSRMAQYKAYSISSGNSARLFTASSYDVSSASTLKMKFWMYHDTGYSSSDDRVQVQVSTDGSTWVNVGDPISRYGTENIWQEHIVDLSGYADETTLRIGFLGISEYGNNIYIDDFELFDPGLILEYSETVYVDVAAGETTQAVFPAWTPDAWQTQENISFLYDAFATTDLTGDQDTSNDFAVTTFTINYPYFYDVQLLSIDSPVSGPGQTQDVEAKIKNIGQFPVRNFFVPLQIGGFVPVGDPEIVTNDFNTNDGGWIPTATWDPVGDWEWTSNYQYSLYTGAYTPPPSAHSGTGLWATKPFDDYTNSGGSSYLSKTLTFAGISNPYLSFWEWHDVWGTWDYVTLTVNGVQKFFNDDSTPSTSWQFINVSLSEFAGQSNVEVVFELYATTVVERAGWYIDDLTTVDVETAFVTEYDESVGVAAWLYPGETRQLIYPDWTPENLDLGVSGSIQYTIQADAQYTADTNPSNNLLTTQITLDYSHDVLVKSITQPSEGRDVTWLHYDTEVNVNALGLTAGGTWEGAIRFTPTELAAYDGFDITKAKFHHGWVGGTSQPSHSGNVKIYDAGTASTPGALLYTQPFTCPAGNAWFTIDLTTGTTIDASKDIWVSIEVTHGPSEYPLGMDASTATVGKGDFIYYSGGWNELYLLGFDNNWNIQAGVESGGPGPGAIDIFIAPGTESIQSIVKNAGTFVESGLTCYADIYEFITDPLNGTLVYEDNITGITLDPLGDEQTVDFDSYNFEDEGIYSLYIEIPLGNDDLPNNNIKDLGIGVDDTPPESTHTLTPATPDGLNGWYVSNVKVKLQADDPEVNGVSSGVDTIKYKIDSGSWQTYTAEVTVSTDGEHTFSYYAVDNVGNEETANAVTFNIDKTKPIIVFSYEVTGNQVQGWDVTFTADATDATSGMDRVEFYLNDVLQATVSGPGPIYQWVLENYHGGLQITIKATAFDKAGNYASESVIPKPLVEINQQHSSPVLKKVVKQTPS